jgi:hypothetical protein
MQQETFQEQLEAIAGKLLYPSETDVPLKVHRLEAGRFSGGPPSPEDLLTHFFPGKKPESMVSESMEGMQSPGHQRFFRYLTDFITIHAQGSYTLRTPAERENALLWRQLRDLWVDNLVNQRWFKAALSDGVRKRIFIAGQFLETEFRAETNEWDIQPGDWFFIETETIET